MNKKALRKNIIKSFSSSKGRFFSIFALMLLGAFALVGLKVTGPDMRTTGSQYFNEQNLSDITIIGDYGIDDKNEEQINKVKGSRQIEYGYLKDVNIKDKTDSVRIFSKTGDISKYIIKSGSDLKKDTDILLSDNYSDRYKIGDKIVFNEKPEIDNKEVLKNHTYEIVGFVDSPEYTSHVNMGPSLSGDGNLSAIAYVNKDNFDSDFYMIARVTFDDTEGLSPYSKDYVGKIQAHKEDIEDLMKGQGDLRLSTIKDEIDKRIKEGENKINNAKSEISEKQQELDDAKVKLNDGKKALANANNELKNANQKLNEGRVTLNDKRQDLESAKTSLDNGRSALLSAENRLDDAYNSIEAGRNELNIGINTFNEKEKELNIAKDKLNSGIEKYNQNKATLDANKAELDKKEAEFNEKKAQFEEINSSYEQYKAQKEELEKGISALELQLQDESLSEDQKILINSQITDLKGKLDYLNNAFNEQTQGMDLNLLGDNKSELDKAEIELKSKRDELNQGYEKLAAAEAELNDKKNELAYNEGLLNDAKAQIEKKKVELSNAEAAYNEGYSEYQSNLNYYNQNLNLYYEGLEAWQEGFNELNEGEAEYQANLSKYEDSVKELEDKQSEYQKGLKEFDEKSKDANQKIKTGEEELADAKEVRDSLETPIYNVYTRREAPGSTGYKIYQTVSEVVDKLANVFPIFLYFVAALVTLTTMTRFVDEERINSGTLKALGYEDSDILKKFTLYGLIAGGLGTIVGIILGHTLLPMIVYNAYGQGFSIPKINLSFYRKDTLITVVLALLSSVLPAYIVGRRQLQEKPSELLLPKPPAAGSKIFLERITPIWKRMSFTHKVTARNIFRYKKRMLMTIFGVAGAVTLLFAGLSVQKSIDGIDQTQFNDLIKYDIIVANNANISKDDKKDEDKLLKSDEIKQYMPIYYELGKKVAGKEKDAQDVRIIVSDDPSNFKDYINLRDRKTHDELPLSVDGAIISERFAGLLGAKVGDDITIEDSYGDEKTVKVAGITEMYAGHFMFMNNSYYKKAFGKDYSPNAEVITLNDNSLDNTSKVSAGFMDNNGVKGVLSNTTLKNQVKAIVDSLNKIMLVLIIVATLLAIVILYNLTNINVAERIRELSTIKVLGFYDNEVTMYIYRETILLSLIGVLVGFLLGYALFAYILYAVPPAEIMFDPALTPRSFVVPTAIITLITGILGVVIYNKLKNVDMLEALKSVE